MAIFNSYFDITRGYVFQMAILISKLVIHHMMLGVH